MQAEIRPLYWEIDDVKNNEVKKEFLSQLSKIARKAFEQDLTLTLNKSGLLDTALDLVHECILNTDDLAAKLYKMNSKKVNENRSFIMLRNKLASKLETRGALVCKNINTEQDWVVTLIKKCETLKRLHAMRYSELSDILQSADSHDRLCIENIYSEGNEVRKMCKSFGLSLETSQNLEERGVTNVADITDHQLSETLEQLPANQQSLLKKMYSNTNCNKVKEKEEQLKKLDKYRKELEEAKSLIQESRKDAKEVFERSQQEFGNRMKNITDKLKLPPNWNIQNVEDPNKLLESVEQVLKITAEKLHITPYETNEEVAAAASGGLARYGINIFGDDAEELSKRPPFPILKKPDYVEWVSPAFGYEVSFFKTTLTNGSSLFYKAVESSGLSIAANVSGGYAGFYASASAHHNKKTSKETEKHLQKSSTYASTTKYIVQPTKAFFIPKEEMQLESEPKRKAKEVIDLASARRFLENYGSHVAAGRHTLGGVYFSTVEVTTKEETEESALLSATGKQFGCEVSGGGWSVSGVVKTETFDISGSNEAAAKKTTEGRFEMTAKTLGPATTDPNTFGEVLQCNNATWFVIDRGDRGSVVPIWELLKEQGDEYAKPAMIIKRAWETKNYSRLSINEKQPSFSAVDQNEAIENELLEMKAYIRKKTLVHDLGSDMCLETLVDIFRLIRTIERKCQTISFKKNVMLVALQITSFMAFLNNTSTKPQSTFGASHNIIRDMIKPETLRGKIELDHNLKHLLQRRRSETTQNTDTMKSINTGNLVEELFKLGEKIESEGVDSDTGNRMAAWILHSALSKEADFELKKALNELAASMGYQKDISDFLTPLGSVEISILAKKISSILEAKFAPEEKVKFTFQVEKEELGSGQFEAMGTVKLVQKRNAFVLWESLANNTTGKTWERNNQTKKWNSNWLGNISLSNPRKYFDPVKNIHLRCKIPFWELQRYTEQDSIEESFSFGRALKWREISKLNKALPFKISDFCVDKNVSSDPPSSPEDVVYLLCRRMAAFKIINSFENWEDDEDSWSSDEEEKDNHLKSTDEKNPFSLLLEHLSKSTLSAKMRLFDMMLQQRYSIPLIIQNNDGLFTYNAAALRFVKTKLFSHSIELLNDAHLPRIAFLSRRPEAQTENIPLIKEVLNCSITSSVSNNTLGTIAELGVGFLKNESKAGNFDPWLTLFVRGDYGPLWKYVIQFSDIIVVELRPDDSLSEVVESHRYAKERITILKWKNNSSLEKPRKDKSKTSIEGSFHGVSRLLKQAIPHYSKKMNIKPEDRLLIANISFDRRQIDNEIIGFNDIEKRLEGENFDGLRQKMQMQNSFAKQCDIQSEIKRICANFVQREDKSEKVRNEEMFRSNIAANQMKLPLIQQFVALLNESDIDLRVIGVQQFSKLINERCDQLLRREKVTKDLAWTYYKENPRDSDALQRYYRAKKEFVNKSFSVTHCWRELSHIYSAKPGMYSKLPKLAAQYLMDGFSLEIMDGDAGSVNIKWFEKVMSELDCNLTQKLGREPKVFVVSIMGTQSTGKSTLLNTMFGCQLQTSAGQCTRGVHLQLAKAENREGIDYVLIMDTEGIRSPEYFGTEGSVSRDNRMATFAVLPAHACLVTTVNEEDSAIKEVLPIVMLAFKGSNIAQESAGRLSSLLFFVYSKVGTSPSDLEGFEENRRQLVMELQNAADKIADSNVAGGDPTMSSTAESGGKNLKKILSNFKTSGNEAESDVKYLGLLNKSEKPPDDVPNFEYGEKVHQLLEYMHKRMKESSVRSQTLKEWVEYLNLVIHCIDTSDFELNFKTALQFQSYNDLQDKLYDIREQLSNKYSEAYNLIEHDLLIAKSEPSIDDLIDKLRRNVSLSDQEQTTAVTKLLKKAEFQQFKTDELRQWNYFKTERQRTWEQLLRDAHEAKWRFGKQEEQLEQAIWNELRKQWETDSRNLRDETRQSVLFCDIFDKHLGKARLSYCPLNTEQKIREEYSQVLKQLQIESGTNWLTKGLEHLADGFEKLMQYVGFKNKPNMEKIAKQLSSQVTEHLRSVKRYNAQSVSDAILFTNEAIKKHSISNKHEKQRLHQVVFTLLNEKLKRIQNQWDRENNVTVKLQNSRDRLYDKFINMCRGFVGAKSVAAEISGALKQAYKYGYKDYLAFDTFQRVSTKKWVKSSETMQAHIEIDLIKMIREDKISDLLHAIYNSRKHYQKILTELIANSSRKDLANTVIEIIKTASSTATTYIEQFQDAFSYTFQHQLEDLLPNELLKQFPSRIWNSITKQEKNDGLTKRDWITIGAEIQNEVESWKLEDAPSVTDSELCDLVTFVMERERGSTSTRERCSEPCPHCKMLCYHPSGHESEESKEAKLHNAHHQPAGICGWRWENSHELDDSSCTENVEEGNVFIIDGVRTPYKDFDKEYSSWALPNSKKRQKLREYIFKNYQEELVKRFSGTKRCKESKLCRFDHDLNDLERERRKAIE